MKLPFVEEIPTFVPRKRPGVDPDLTVFELQVLDAVDVGEQRDEFNTKIAVRAYNMGVLLWVFMILINGPQLIGVVQHWLAPQPAHTIGVVLGAK